MKIYIVEAQSGDIHCDSRIVEVFTDKTLAEQFLALVQELGEKYNTGTTLEKVAMMEEPSYDPCIHGIDLKYVMYDVDVCTKIEKKRRY